MSTTNHITQEILSLANDTSFNAKNVSSELIQWIRDWFESTADEDAKAVIGISGGKDSTIVAKLCVEALGANRVHGVFMPMEIDYNKVDEELELSKEIAKSLNIETTTITIGSLAKDLTSQMSGGISAQAEVNLLPRLRMTALYMVAQTIGGRVSNNCNLSERVMGYSTQWGDNVGDFAPIQNLTVSEVRELGHYLGLKKEWVDKVPIDGLNVTYDDKGNEKVITDEDMFGMTYEAIDAVIRGTSSNDEDIETVKFVANQTMFKRRLIANYDSSIPVHLDI